MKHDETYSLQDGWAGPDGDLGRYIARESDRTFNSYCQQPNYVEEHAKLEQDTAQGGYQHRQLYELIQNGSDALVPPESVQKGGGPTRVSDRGRIEVRLTENCLYCADNGYPIDHKGVRALMFSHMSPKRGSEQIGTFGLGFKAVLGVSNSPEFFSRSGSFRFDRRRARNLILEAVPGASSCPVLRLPEPIHPIECWEQDEILRELMGWAVNIVRLPLINGAHRDLREQIKKFPSEFILFVPHVERLVIAGGSEELSRVVELKRAGDECILSDGDETSRWMLFKRSHELSDEARADPYPGDDRNQVPIWWAAPLDRSERFNEFWAHFPTLTASLVPGILNAPWKTNADRQNLLPGPYNDDLIESAAELIADELPKLAGADDPARHLDALPRRIERGDNPHADFLRRALFGFLHNREIVPDQEGRLRFRGELSYPPQELKPAAQESKVALESWASHPERPVDWLHHSALTRDRLARIDRLHHPEGLEQWGYKPPRSSLAAWIEALVESTDPADQESLVRASIAAIQTIALIAEDVRTHERLGRVVLTAAGGWQPPDPEEVFLPYDSPTAIGANEAMSIVHPDLVNDANTLAVLKELGLKQPSPEIRFKKVMEQIVACQYRQHIDPDLLESFWKTSRALDTSEAVAIVKKYPRWQRLLHVRTCAGHWNKLHLVLMPGKIVPGDGSRDGGVTVDVVFHQPDCELLQELGVVDAPTNAYELNTERVFKRYQEKQREKYRRRGDLPSRPRSELLEFLSYGKVGPLDVFPVLSEVGKALYTDSLLGIEACYGPWLMWHKTQDKYPKAPFESLQIQLLREHGRIQTQGGIVPLADALGPEPENLAALHTLLRHPSADKIKETFDLSEPSPEIFGEGEPVPLIDIWPGLEGWLSPDLVESCLVSCERIDVIGHKTDCSFQAPNIYLAIGVDDDEYRALKLVSDSLELRLLDSDIKAILQRRTPAEVEARRREVRQCSTDAERLLAAVGEGCLRSGLPRSLLAVLEEEQGPLTGLDIAEAAIATYHTDALRQFKASLGHLNPPRQWAGRRIELEFVHSLGFSDEWAGERKRHRSPFMEVVGPQSLPELHPYQRTVAANLRAMLLPGQNESAGQRGMISMPTGSGKTRVAVQAVVEAIRDDDFPSGVLWVADRDELCEQAVEAWEGVWRSEGIEAKQLRISRLWGAQPAPLPTSELHVVVASVQTLYSRLARRSEEYEFLKNFKIVIFDEAHRSIAPTSTSVMREIGLTYQQGEEEPRLLGLTATPYRGHDEAETRWLARRYGEKRLDRGAFSSDDPQEVIRELQDGGVLARADHELIEGGTFELSDSDWDELRKFVPESERGGSWRGWLPQSVEDRIAANTDRTRHIIEAYEKHIEPGWPTLIFATSVEHAQTLAALLNRSGITSRPVSGTTEPATRRRVVEEFRSGEIKALVNYAVFREGFDAPKTRAIIVARPVYSPNLYFQMIGRGLRGPKNGGDERCLILNVRDNIEGFGDALAFSELDWLWDR
ncbi:DEAD/DEAH box helicase [Candidatus Poriferisocius sp.]|uniref:DEAD/DEAH box helicase n=1 Tax=Candidatus Poriferisocius sp. TaxID=3101276 RepID=UPI003B01A7BA